MLPAFGKHIDFKINVVNDEILLMGQVEEAAGKLLQGTLELNLNEPIKVKSIVLHFSGRMKVSWVEGVGHHQNYYKQERNIISHSWEFINPQLQGTSSISTQLGHGRRATVLTAGKHTWPFELMLPGNLPQSLESDVGNITYRLKAIVERTAFIQNIVKKKTIRILRCIAPFEMDLIQSLEIHNTWDEKMTYDVSIPSKMFAFNDTIPISFKILPLASQLKVKSITASIKEYCTYKANSHKKTDTRLVRTVKVDKPFPDEITNAEEGWNCTVDLTVPEGPPLVFSDADSEMIRIRHRLKFVLSLGNADGHLSELRCAVQIGIVESFAMTEELSRLPAYEDMWRSVPYDARIVEQLRARSHSIDQSNIPQLRLEPNEPVSISGSSRELSLSSTSLLQRDDHTQTTSPMVIPGSNASSRNHSRRPSLEIPDSLSFQPQQIWWNGIDLGKVPSYRSTTTLNSNLFPSSLPPNYDSLTPPTSSTHFLNRP